MLDIALAQRDGPLIVAAFEAARAIHSKAWESSPATLRQLEGWAVQQDLSLSAAPLLLLTLGSHSIGDVSMRRLAMYGYSTIRSVAQADAAALGTILSRNVFVRIS